MGYSRQAGRLGGAKAKRGRGGRNCTREDPEEPTPAEHRASMSWAQRLKRIFGIDIETCLACGGAVRFTACIEDPVVVEKTPTCRDEKGASAEDDWLPPCRAPIQYSSMRIIVSTRTVTDGSAGSGE